MMRSKLFASTIANFVFVTILLSGSVIANAQTIEELQQADKLRIKVRIEPKQNIIAKQQIKLLIEVATDKWFSGGTRIGRVEIDDAIVLQRESFAVNSSRKENNKSWVIQEWTLVIYPQREGEFTIPSFPVNLSIAGENLEPVIGQVTTRPVSFIATIPDTLRNEESWVVTTRYEIEASFDKPIENLKPGDALIRTIRISADDLPAMMLPKVEVEDIPGIAIYHKPPRISDKVNRGDYLAERIETFTYVFEKPGEYQLPAQSYPWWNLETGRLETIELPETVLRVSRSSAVATDGNQKQSLKNKSVDIVNLLRKSAPVLVLFIAVWLVWRRFPFYGKNKKTEKPAERSEIYLQREFNKACERKNFENAIQLFYQWLDLYGGESFQGSVRKRITESGQTREMNEFNEIMRSIFTPDKNNKIDLRQFSEKFVSELKQTDQSRGLRRWDIELKLN